jgi:hypothetical protein
LYETPHNFIFGKKRNEVKGKGTTKKKNLKGEEKIGGGGELEMAKISKFNL